MELPSREIIENARIAAKIDSTKKTNCYHMMCNRHECPYVFEHGKECMTNANSNQQFFKDFLAKYDTEESMFKVGDRVRVRDDLRHNQKYGTDEYCDDMDYCKDIIL